MIAIKIRTITIYNICNQLNTERKYFNLKPYLSLWFRKPEIYLLLLCGS